MRLALTYIQYAFIRTFEYRAELVVWVFLESIPMLILMMVWAGIYAGQDLINGYSLSGIIEYYFLVLVLDSVVSTHFEQRRCEQIRLGKIDVFLTKPLSFPRQILLSEIGSKALYVAIGLPIFLTLYTVLTTWFIDSQLILSIPKLFSVFLTVLYGFGLEYYLALLVVFATFWFEGAEGLQHFKWFFGGLFSGLLVPISFMPEWLQNMVAVLPFRYFIAVPIEILQGQTSLHLSDIIYMITSLLLLWLISRVVWHFAKRQYASAGG